MVLAQAAGELPFDHPSLYFTRDGRRLSELQPAEAQQLLVGASVSCGRHASDVWTHCLRMLLPSFRLVLIPGSPLACRTCEALSCQWYQT